MMWKHNSLLSDLQILREIVEWSTILRYVPGTIWGNVVTSNIMFGALPIQKYNGRGFSNTKTCGCLATTMYNVTEPFLLRLVPRRHVYPASQSEC